MKTNKSVRFAGEVQFDVPANAIWHALTNPAIVSPCVPGLIHWEEIEPDYKFSLLLALVSQTTIEFPTILLWDALSPNKQLVFSATATPSAMGLFTLEGQFDLSEEAKKQTTLTFTAVVTPPNPFFNQIIKNVVPRQIELFFRCFKANLT